MASSRSVKAGRAYVEFFLEDNPLRRGLAIAERRMRQFGASVQNIGRKAFTAGLGGLAAFALPVRQMMNFDDAIRAAAATTDDAAGSLELFKNIALDIAKTSGFTATEVANMMTELARAGHTDPSSIKAMTAAVLNMSKATGTDATRSAEILIATLNQYKMGAGEAARVSDVLTLAANMTSTSVDALGEAMSYAGPVAASMGMTLEDTVAILGQLGNIGVQGSNAGTALRRMVTMTAAEAEKMKEIFGVSFVNPDGSLRPLIQVMGELGGAMAGLPEATKIARYNEAFGLLGITASIEISNSAQSIQTLSAALQEGSGAAAEAAKFMEGGLGGAFRRMLGAADAAAIGIGTTLTATLESLGTWVGSTATQIGTWVSQNEGLVVSAAKASGYLLAGGAALIIFGKGLQIAAIGATILNAGMGVVSIGVSALTGLFSLGTTVVGLAATAWGILSAATASGTIAYSLATGAVAAFQIAVLTLTSTTALAAIAAVAMEVATIAGSVAYSLATAAIVGVQIALIALTSGQVLSTVATYGLAAAHAIANAVLTGGAIAYSMITWAVSMFQIAMLTLASAEGITAVATAVLSGAMSALGTVVMFLTSPIGLIIAGIVAIGAASGMIGNPITALTGMLGGVVAAFSGMAGQIMATASMLLDVYKPAWDLIVGMIGSGDIAGAMTFAWELAKASFSLGIAYIMQAWGEFSDWLSGSVQSIGLTIGEIWGAMWDNFIGFAQYAWAAIKDTLNAVVDFGRSLVGATKIDRKSNVDQVTKDRNTRQDARAQESFDARAKLEQQQQSGEGARQAAVDAQLVKINELITTEKTRTEEQARWANAANEISGIQPVLPPAQQALANTLTTGTAAAMTAKAQAITAVDKNTAEGQKAIYESLDQSGKADETVGAIGSLETTLVDEFERTRREDASAPRLAGSRRS
jgi:TP901 family phage tail tape measure protein